MRARGVVERDATPPYSLPPPTHPGTNICFAQYNGGVAIWTPSLSKYQPSNVYAGVGSIQTVNGNNFAYGGYYTGDQGGFVCGSNLITGLGYYYYVGSQRVTDATMPPPLKAGYAGSTYYVYVDGDNRLYSGTSLTNIVNSFQVTNASIAGIPSIQPQRLVNDGNLSTYNFPGTMQMSKTTTAPILGVASVTASIVEIT